MSRRTDLRGYAILVERSSLLLCRISERLPADAGRWTLPGGGIEFDETIDDGIRRELDEETGLAISLTRVAWVESEVFALANEELRVVRLVYEGRIVGGELRAETDGTTDRCDWIPLAGGETPPMVGIASRAFEWARRVHNEA